MVMTGTITGTLPITRSVIKVARVTRFTAIAKMPGSWYLRVASNLTLKVFGCPYLTQRLYPPLQSLLLTQRFILHLGISSRILQSEGSVPSDHGSLMQRFTSPSSVCWFQALKKSACMVDASPDESVTLPAVVGM
jgi:hypothetical protein